MRKIVFLLAILFLSQHAYSEERYNPSADAMADIKSAIVLAKETDRHVLLRLAVTGAAGVRCMPSLLKRMRILCG